MKCWYVFNQICERQGICEGCEVYLQWHEERERTEETLRCLMKKHPEVKKWSELLELYDTEEKREHHG